MFPPVQEFVEQCK